MSDRITRKRCEGVLSTYCRVTGRRDAATEAGAWDGTLFINDESGVKRVRQGVGTSGVRDIGPGFLTWRELYTFLHGMLESEFLRRN